MGMADTPLPLILPLLAAMVYVTGALLLKRATQLGADPWRIAWVTNLFTVATFAPLLLLGGNVRPLEHWWQPAVVAMLFVLGQVLSMRTLQAGDVSVATPVMGSKIILVALLTTVLLRDRLTPALWAAAGFSSAAIALLNVTRGAAHHHVGKTIVLATLTASTYALFDVLVQKWTPGWGGGRFLPVMMLFVAIYSLGLRAIASGRTTPHEARRWLFAGSSCIALQGAIFVSAISLFGQATVANVLYSSRGLWSVVAVWLVGHWFKNQERHHGPKVLAARLGGAILMSVAVILVVLQGRPKPPAAAAEVPSAPQAGVK